MAGESTSDEALPSRQEHIEHVAVVVAAGVCRSDQRITVFKDVPIPEVVEEMTGTIGLVCRHDQE